MAISNLSDAEARLLEEPVDGCVDYRGRPVLRSSSGGWRSAKFMIGVEVAERFAYFGIESNLITYLTGPLGQSTVTAAENVNVWSGTTYVLPLFGALVADSFLGRYRTVVVASLIYVLGLGLLTLSTMLPASTTTFDCQNTNNITLCTSPPDHQFQVILFLFSIYLVAVAQSGHRPCVQALGADQFDEQDPEECKIKSSFFNWWGFGICLGALSTRLILNYIQDNLSWALGFGIPCIVMVVALSIFLLGTKTYRFSIKRDVKSPFERIGLVFVAAARNWRISPSAMVVVEEEEEACRILPHHQNSDQFKFLNKALLALADGSNEYENVGSSISDIEDAKALLSVVPVWMTSLAYGIVTAQCATFFTKQGATMDRTVALGFDIPAASLQSFISLAIILTLPVYDRIFVPFARAFTGKPAGITTLQRVGTGLFLCTISMVIAALVEMMRLKTAKEHGLVDEPNVTVPMSVWWLIPQYVVLGVTEACTMVGLQEFFYNQFPTELRSVGLSCYLAILGVGNFLSGFLISTVDKLTSRDGQYSWFDNNLNHGHLDYFYWLVAGLSALGLISFLYFSKSFIYKRGTGLVYS
ncbi:hypothetical protein JRO89_XS07G0265100 [Xanthoceras sorbifolium]|uniref:Protein NRT1/ PTR FAMILY 5.10-like n=1 Tax=Xanthoceras sorbifolium TaxID=99658 RepID=A0ABQ8HV50_9ROSI|nr:hypothetical protein JRO89_XS07G0265100 [Xanthoceras sorbifolium]